MKIATAADMQAHGIAQQGDAVLAKKCLPAYPLQAQDLIPALQATLDTLARIHTFSKGMGIAAPQVGVSLQVAIIRPLTGEEIWLINPKVTSQSLRVSQEYEGCLSFFDTRGCVPRPLSVTVTGKGISGEDAHDTFTGGTARLVCHEIDHLHGLLYSSRMLPGTALIPVSEYRGEGEPWRDYQENREGGP
jgi:peptide deformylase